MSQTPDTPGLAQQRMLARVRLVRDVYEGTLRLRERAEDYLPRFEREAGRDYRGRLATSVLFNAFRKTVGAFTGMVFRKPVKLGDDVPELVRTHWENIDMTGRHGDVFCRDLFEDAMVDGHAAIFVDMPAVPAGNLRTLADERQLGLRPYWVAVRKQDIVRVRTVNVGGRVILARFAFREKVTEEDPDGNEREVLQVRDYRLVTGTGEDGQPAVHVVYILHTQREKDDGQAEWEVAPPEPMTINRIPVSTAYTNRTGFMESEPPLLDLVLENILHYQVRSDRQNVLHIASVPIPIFRGLKPEGRITVGVNEGLEVEAGGGASYLEPTGASLSHSRQELQDIEQRMAALGLSMLQRQTRAAETAEAKRIDKAEADSQLAAAARGLEDAVEGALELHALWLDIDTGGSVEVNKDFEPAPLSPQLVDILLRMVGQGVLSLETLWTTLQQGEVLPDTFDPEAELARLLGSGMIPLPAPELEPEDEDPDDAEEEDEGAAA